MMKLNDLAVRVPAVDPLSTSSQVMAESANTGHDREVSKLEAISQTAATFATLLIKLLRGFTFSICL